MQAKQAGYWNGVRVIPYQVTRNTAATVHPWLADFETKVIRGDACFQAMRALQAQGFTPDVVVAHPGWGESLFVKDVWPNTRLGLYCEFYYQAKGSDVGFDPEFKRDDAGELCRLRLKNLNHQAHFAEADAGISPTHWQASTYPEPFRRQISVVHDGIDTQAVSPNPAVGLRFQGQRGQTINLSKDQELVTFVNRNLEPYRGYHRFMRALPALLKARPNARVLLVGGNDVSYGAKPPPGAQGSNWRDIFAREVRPQMPEADWARVHFLGKLPYNQFLALLQLSTVHVYLTYPFVLSWSLLEAMSAGCAVVASRTAPVLEAIRDGDTGCLVDFFDTEGLVASVCRLLDDPAERQRLGANARRYAQTHYDLTTVCLPAQLAWLKALAEG